MMYLTEAPSPLGVLTLASDGETLTGLWFAGQKHFGATIGETTIKKDELTIFDKARAWLERYFAGKRPDPHELNLNPEGTPFRRKVWARLCEIPFGETITYGEIATDIARREHGRPASSRAVGGAVGRNPISIIIPCHRVIGANKSLTGYAGGFAAKVKLLQLEGVDTTALRLPRLSRSSRL